jgi:hypothetical protein
LVKRRRRPSGCSSLTLRHQIAEGRSANADGVSRLARYPGLLRPASADGFRQTVSFDLDWTEWLTAQLMMRKGMSDIAPPQHCKRMSAQNGRWKDRMSQSNLDAGDRGIPAIAPRAKGSQETLRWRKTDSKHRSLSRNALLFSGGAGDASGRKRGDLQRALGAPIPRSQPGDKGDNGAHHGRGTEGSNPSPSSGESGANPSFRGESHRWSTNDLAMEISGGRTEIPSLTAKTAQLLEQLTPDPRGLQQRCGRERHQAASMRAITAKTAGGRLAAQHSNAAPVRHQPNLTYWRFVTASATCLLRAA